MRRKWPATQCFLRTLQWNLTWLYNGQTSGRLLAQTCIQSFLSDTLHGFPFACGASVPHLQEKKFIVAEPRYLVDSRPLWLENDGVDTHAMSLLLYIILSMIKFNFFFSPLSIKQSMNIKVSSLNVLLSSAAGPAPPVNTASHRRGALQAFSCRTHTASLYTFVYMCLFYIACEQLIPCSVGRCVYGVRGEMCRWSRSSEAVSCVRYGGAHHQACHVGDSHGVPWWDTQKGHC